MGSGSGILTLMRASFPGRERLVERTYREDEAFRALCRDYRTCVAALHRFEQPGATQAPPLWREYAELKAELESEIRSWLNAVEAGPTPSTGRTR